MASRLVKVLAAGRSIQKELVRNFCRKWATNQAKAWARMLKVGWPVVEIFGSAVCFVGAAECSV